MMKKLVWIASYPKSGNTWFRVFLSNLFNPTDAPADINNLERTPIASSRNYFDEFSGINSSELSHDEIDNLRPAVYEEIARNSKTLQFLKIHDAYTSLPSGDMLIPAAVTKGVIYIIRNPLDVAVSFAHHSACSPDKMIRLMNDDNHSFCSRNDMLMTQLRQKLLSWSAHVLSWTEQVLMPVHIMRYEDMLANPLLAFTKALAFLEIPFTSEQIQKAVAFSSFDILRQQEEKNGFKEKTIKSVYFFRKGKAGSWREELSVEQQQIIIDNHAMVMKKFGYLTEQNTLSI